MTPLEELLELRPIVTELRDVVQQLRRDLSRVTEERDARDAIIAQLRASIITLRNAHRVDRTPPMGELIVSDSND